MTNKKIILEWKKLNYHYIMSCVGQNQLIIQKKNYYSRQKTNPQP